MEINLVLRNGRIEIQDIQQTTAQSLGKNEMVKFADTLIDKEGIMLNDVIQSEKNRHEMIALFTCKI